MGRINQRQSHKPNQSRVNSNTSFLELGEALKKQYYGDISILSDFSTGVNADKLIEKTEEFVRKKGEKLSSTQLRNIYDKILNAENIMSLKMIRPQLAYLAGRATGKGAQDSKAFLSFIDLLIKEATTESTEDFKKFMEMIVAYHKYYGKN